MTASQPTDGPSFQATPNAEKYVLEADALRRRQLQSALVHGSGQTWRERRRIWPATIGGVTAIVIIVAVVAIVGAFHQQQLIQARQSPGRPPTTTPPSRPAGPANPYTPAKICNDLRHGTDYEPTRQTPFQGGTIYLYHSRTAQTYCAAAVKTTLIGTSSAMTYVIEKQRSGSWVPERSTDTKAPYYLVAFIHDDTVCHRFSAGTTGLNGTVTWGKCG
jgi:hypothetical protein